MDGAPAHFARNVREHVDENYTPWIGRGGTIAWPARSPDLTPLDFFLWGTMKERVYLEVPESREELLQTIMTVADEIRADTATQRKKSYPASSTKVVCVCY